MVVPDDLYETYLKARDFVVSPPDNIIMIYHYDIYIHVYIIII